MTIFLHPFPFQKAITLQWLPKQHERNILHNTYTIHMANSTKVSQTSIAHRESTKDRRECKLPAVRKTKARDLRAN